jgi:sensor histidine kinase YesM
VNSNDLVTIEEETDFMNSYIFLQQIRYGEGFTYNNRIDKKYYTSFILPLTLQLLIENALKHNTISPQSPLHIELFVDENNHVLVVRNNFQPRKAGETTKTGLINLEQRYLSFVDKTIRYQQDERYFTVDIPIISDEE